MACLAVACLAVACLAVARLVVARLVVAGRMARCRTAGRRKPGRTRARRTGALRTGALRMPALRMRADPMPAVRAAADRTVFPRMALPRWVLPPRVLPRWVLSRRVLRLTLLRPMAGLIPGVPAAAPMARRGLDGTGCRTGAGCRQGRTACTGRPGRARRVAPRAGTMGLGRLSKSTMRTAGADRARRRLGTTFPAAPVRAGLVPGGRRTEQCHPTGLPARPDFQEPRGQPGQLGPRRCASTRRPGRASRSLTAVTGPARRRSRRVR
jgi:hypothetical protein